MPKPVARAFPTQLEGFMEPVVLSYPLESIVSEKLDAVVSRGELTSRMKDFYDLHYLAPHCQFRCTGTAGGHLSDVSTSGYSYREAHGGCGEAPR